MNEILMGNKQWYQMDSHEDPGNRMVTRYGELFTADWFRLMDACQNIGIYCGLSEAGTVLNSFSILNENSYYMLKRLKGASDNVTASIVDTLTNKITSSQPEPEYISDGGDYTTQEQCTKLNLFVRGTINQLDLYRRAPLFFRNSLVAGTCILKVISEVDKRENGSILIEEKSLHEVMIERPYGAFTEDVSTVIESSRVSKSRLLEKFPDKEEFIEGAAISITHSLFDDSTTQGPILDQCTIYEGFHYCGTCGRHIIATNLGTLLDEEWDCGLPYIFFKYNQLLYRFWGQGLAEQLRGKQYKLDKINKFIDTYMKMDVPIVIIPQNANDEGMKKSALQNIPYSIIRTPAGSSPAVFNPGGAPDRWFTERDKVIQSMYQVAGVSQMSAASRKEPGIDSGKALLTMLDVESDRFAVVSLNYEALFVEIGSKIIQCAKYLSEAGYPISAKAQGKESYNTIDWKDINLAEDSYSIKKYAVNSLPNRPEGRLKILDILMQNKVIDPQLFRKLSKIPDLERQDELDESIRDIIRKEVDSIAAGGPYTAPEPTDDLAFGLVYSRQAYSLARLQKKSEEILENLRTYMAACKDKLDQMTATQQPPPQGPLAPAPQQ